MEYRKEQILMQQLPAAVFVKNFIEGHPADCEEFLTDFINASKLVMEKGNEKFVLRNHKEQSHGQADIYNSHYELDFKILADTDYMEAKRMFSYSITEICPGLTAVGSSELQGSKTVFDIIKCLRNKTMDDLKNIEDGTIRLPENKVIRHILSKISVDKNILLFLPHNYFIKGVKTNLDIAEFIVSCIASDLEGLFEYRKMKVNKDIYVAFVSNDYFIIAQENNNSLIFYDMINCYESDIFNYLFHVSG